MRSVLAGCKQETTVFITNERIFSLLSHVFTDPNVEDTLINDL